MTQILVTLNDGISTQSVRRAISMLRGVEATSVMKSVSTDHKKTLAQQKYVKESLGRALKEVKEAERGERTLKSLDDFLEELELEEAV